jgi:hypothetical protein
MRKVNLDLEYDAWRIENYNKLSEEFLLNNLTFENFIEERWRAYQDREGLIDESNTSIDEEQESQADLKRKYDLDDIDGSKQEAFCN